MEKEVKYTIRLPQEMHSEIEKSAKENRRSLNNEMLTIFDNFINELRKSKISEVLTEEEQVIFDKIKSLPLDEQKAILKKLSTTD
jgi:SpoVK/Ycf46/Vps4 family AAA+-type ATPase